MNSLRWNDWSSGHTRQLMGSGGRVPSKHINLGGDRQFLLSGFCDIELTGLLLFSRRGWIVWAPPVSRCPHLLLDLVSLLLSQISFPLPCYFRQWSMSLETQVQNSIDRLSASIMLLPVWSSSVQHGLFRSTAVSQLSLVFNWGCLKGSIVHLQHNPDILLGRLLPGDIDPFQPIMLVGRRVKT